VAIYNGKPIFNSRAVSDALLLVEICFRKNVHSDKLKGRYDW